MCIILDIYMYLYLLYLFIVSDGFVHYWEDFLKEVISYVHQSCFYMLKIQENMNMFIFLF